MKKYKTILSIILLCFLFIESCNKDQGPFYKAVPIDPTDSVKFALDIQPIFNTYCIACHNQTHSKLNLQACCSYDQLFFTGFSASYVDTANPGSSRLYRYLTGSPTIMPPSGSIPQVEIDKVLLWIKQGGRNN